MYLLGLDRNDLAAPLDLLHGIGLALSCLLQHGLHHQVMIKAFVTGGYTCQRTHEPTRYCVPRAWH